MTEKHNIVDFQKRKTPPEPPPHNKNEPLINILPCVKYLMVAILLIHLVVTFILPVNYQDWAYLHLRFVPANFNITTIFAPLTHMFLHSGWLHLGMNLVMLLAFGSGVERWLGGRKMLILFLASGLFGVALHFVLNLNSPIPVVGASGGISGLFAAALVMLSKQSAQTGQRFPFLPLILLWVGISVLFGFIDNPQMGVQAGEIAWAAHVGGFLGGFVILKFMRVI